MKWRFRDQGHAEDVLMQYSYCYYVLGEPLISDVEFDGGYGKAQGLIGIQAREKLTQKMGWNIVDGDSPKPVPNNTRPAEFQPKPQQQQQEVNDF